MSPQELTPQEREIVEIVREFADLLRQEFTREMHAYHREQQQLWRDTFDELHRELFASSRETAAKAQECAEMSAKMLASSHFPSKQTSNKESS